MKKVFVCPTTHWDREWVMTFGQYRIRLVNLIDKLLGIMERHPEYAFYLDGQAAVLDDYLEIKPENRPRLSALLKSGRLTAGPWYVLADQFLQSSEATIRNLIMGTETVRALGGTPENVGYVPDSFGSIASLPMFLSGFGIRRASFGRGRPYWDERLPYTEFIWKYASSDVLAVNHGYGNGIYLSYPDIWTDIFKEESFHPDPETAYTRFMSEAENQERGAALPALYFSVGVDHMEPRESLIDVVAYINTHQDKYELVFGTIGQYLDYIGKYSESSAVLKTYSGEMRGGPAAGTLEGTLSSRIETKKLNDACDILLCTELEPLATAASLYAGFEYPHGHLRDLWKQYILNHPHDSICGCNIDQVDRDIRNRYEYVLNTGEYLKKDIINALTGAIDTSGVGNDAVPLVVFNPLNYERDGHVHNLVRVPRMFKYKSYALYDESGALISSCIQFVTVKRKDLESVYMTGKMLARVISKDAREFKQLPDDQVFTVLDVDFVASGVPSMGYKTYNLRPSEEKAVSIVKVAENSIENEYIKVTLNNNGTFNLTDKHNGGNYNNLNYFIDKADTGDTYRHLEPADPGECTTKNISAKWRLREQYGHGAVFETEYDFMLPEKYVDGKRSEFIKPMHIRIQASLYAGLDYLNVTAEIDNTCETHCLRAVFDTGIAADVSYAYDHFNIIERPAAPDGQVWREWPFTEFICAADPNNPVRSLCVSTKGLPAYEAVRRDAGVSLQIELLRAVDSIGDPAGANYPVPDAQCLGKHKFEYAIFTGADNPEAYLEKAADYHHAMFAESTGIHGGTLPASASFINLECDFPKPYISCLKRAESAEVVLRIWNPGHKRSVNLTGYLKFREVWRASLDERKLERIEPGAVFLPEKELTTLIMSV